MTRMPSARASRGLRISTARPLIRISPASFEYAPLRIFISVDFPAPFSPSRRWTAPASSVRSTPSSATTPGNTLRMPRISSTGAAAIGLYADLAGRDEGVDFVERGYAVQGAQTGAADAGGGVGGPQRLIHRLPLDEGIDEPAAKHVAGACRVDGVDAERRLLIQAVAVENHRAVLTERDAEHLIVSF